MNNEETLDQYAAIEQARLEGIQKQKMQAKGTPQKKQVDLPWGTFFLMTGTALLFDACGLLINALPLAGGFIEGITITPAFLILFWIWCSMKGIKLMKGFRGVFTAVLAFVGFIPIFNALPTRTAEVVMLKASIMAENKLKKEINK